MVAAWEGRTMTATVPIDNSRSSAESEEVLKLVDALKSRGRDDVRVVSILILRSEDAGGASGNWGRVVWIRNETSSVPKLRSRTSLDAVRAAPVGVTDRLLLLLRDAVSDDGSSSAIRSLKALW